MAGLNSGVHKMNKWDWLWGKGGERELYEEDDDTDSGKNDSMRKGMQIGISTTRSGSAAHNLIPHAAAAAAAWICGAICRMAHQVAFSCNSSQEGGIRLVPEVNSALSSTLK